MSAPVLSVDGLKVRIGDREIVRGVRFDIRPGERVGIVGESGSGKSLTALSVLRLLPRSASIVDGSMLHQDRDLAKLSEEQLGSVRGRSVSMIFQNAAAALNPVLKIGRQVSDVIAVHSGGGKAHAEEAAREVLSETGLADVDAVMSAYPHQLSGGMAQRVLIAMALSSRPELLIADEPTTGLDMSIQAQVLSLLRKRVESIDAALLLISHDIAVVGEICDRIAVMYAGRIVEIGTAQSILHSPRHPYTKALLQCATDSSISLRGTMPTIQGEPPDLSKPVTGCSFADRCPISTEICRTTPPPQVSGTNDSLAECHHV